MSEAVEYEPGPHSMAFVSRMTMSTGASATAARQPAVVRTTGSGSSAATTPLTPRSSRGRWKSSQEGCPASSVLPRPSDSGAVAGPAGGAPAVHDMREHEAWFRGEVEEGLRQADDADRERTPHDQVRSSWRRQRAELERRAAGRTA